MEIVGEVEWWVSFCDVLYFLKCLMYGWNFRVNYGMFEFSFEVFVIIWFIWNIVCVDVDYFLFVVGM